MSNRRSDAPSSGPLTEQELDQLSLWHGRGASLRERAVAEIRERRADEAKLSKPRCTVCRDYFSQDGRCGTCVHGLKVSHAAEIRELRADNAKLCRWKIKYGRHIKNIEADNAKLREYVRHKPECNNVPDAIPDTPCTCGLDDALKEPQEGG